MMDNETEGRAVKESIHPPQPWLRKPGVRPALLFVFLLLTTLAPLSGQRSAMAMAKSKTAKGDNSLADKDYKKAEELFREAIKIQPELPTPRLGLGAALVGQQRFDEALDALKQAESSFVAWADNAAAAELQQRQDAFRTRQEYETTVNTINPGGLNLESSAPPSARAEVTRVEAQTIATGHWKLGDETKVPASLFHYRGVSHLRSGRRDEGIDSLRICLALDAEHGLANYNISVALLGLGQVKESKTHLDAAVKAGVYPHPMFVEDLDRALKLTSG